MKNRLALFFSLLLAGSLFFCCGFLGKVKKDVTIEGVEVGGMTFSAAAEKVRARIAETLLPLQICTPDAVFEISYPELGFTDDVDFLLKTAKRGEKLTAKIERVWANAEERLAEICKTCSKEGKNAELTFSKSGFSYKSEENGVVSEYSRLLADVTEALKSGGTEVTLHTHERTPAVTEEMLRSQTKLLSSFTTTFNGSNAPRTANIRLAAERISGTVVESGGTFSFNETVGKRTAENGFREALVIFDGEFVQGVGGGVCQVSTTLFNAALRAGMKIAESRPHSLSVSYVPPSLDAMVSEYSDMKFINLHPYPIFLLAKTGNNSVTFSIYGKPDGRKYVTESRVLFKVDPPPALVVEGEEEKVVRAEREGIASESYLLVFEGDTLLSRTLIRRDTYSTVQGIVQRPPEEAPEEPPAEGETVPSKKFFGCT